MPEHDLPVVLVTGASGGVGRGIGIALGRSGWTVWIAARRSVEGRAAAEAVGLPCPNGLLPFDSAIATGGVLGKAAAPVNAGFIPGLTTAVGAWDVKRWGGAMEPPAAQADASAGISRRGSQSVIPSFQQYVSSLTTPALYSDTIWAERIVRWSPSPTLTVHSSPWGGAA